MCRLAGLIFVIGFLGWSLFGTIDSANAKPSGPPRWATISGPGLPSDVYLPTWSLDHLGSFADSCIRSAGEEAAITEWSGWRTYKIRAYYGDDPRKFNAYPDVFVTRQTYYLNDAGQALGKVEAEMDILDPAGSAAGWGTCRQKWFNLTQGQLAIVSAQIDRHVNTNRFMTFACRWRGTGFGGDYVSVASASCQ